MKKFFIAIAIPLAIGISGALLAEYILQIGVLGTANLFYFLAAGMTAAVLVFALFRKKVLAGAAFIGFLFIPYFAFLLGQIDIYMVDDNLIQGMRVVEVRPVMDKITFGTPDRGEIAVWSGPQTLKLHPGENRLRLGRFNLVQGVYQGGTVYISDIQVDIQADLSIMKDPVSGQSIPADYYASAFETIKLQMVGNVGGFNIRLDNALLSGGIGSFTINVGQMILPIVIPQINYPGVGGPDVTVDIVLDEMGRPDPSKIKTIIDMPPGFSGAFSQMPGVEFR